LEPLLAAIRNNREITGIYTSGRFEIKTLSYADDVTIIVANIFSLKQAFFTLQKFESASTLRLNFSKTHGLLTSALQILTLYRQYNGRIDHCILLV